MSAVPVQKSEASPVRAMVVDDSAVVRGLLVQALEQNPGIVVVGRASNGQHAVTEAGRLDLDVIVLDIDMPIMDGITALPLLLKAAPGAKILMASTQTTRNAKVTLQALELGAADYVPKPEAGLSTAEEFKRELVAKVLALGHARQKQNPVKSSPSSPASSEKAAATPAVISAPAPIVTRKAPLGMPGRFTVLAIGGSTGAPPALLNLLSKLGPNFRQPVLLTQHMPPTFTAMLAEQLEKASGRPCAEARDGEPVAAGRTYVAPGGWHMTVVREGPVPTLKLNQDPPEHYCRPAVDPLFRSVADVYGASALAVILTGMGSDGAAGARKIAESGGRFIVQDEATSVVWGMPGAAAKTGLSDAVLPLDDIAPWVQRAMGASS